MAYTQNIFPTNFSCMPQRCSDFSSLCVPRTVRPVSRSHGSLFELESSASQSDSMGLSAEHQSLVSKSEECLGFEDMWSDQVDTSLAYQPEVSLSERVAF